MVHFVNILIISTKQYLGISPPSSRAQAPAIARSQSREPPRPGVMIIIVSPVSGQVFNHNSLPPRSREVIAHALGVLEEGVRHLSAHSVTPTIPRICPKTDDTDIFEDGCSFGYDDDNNYDDVDDDDNYDCDNNH